MGNRLGIDPDKFQHVSSDDKKTILRHKDGHELTIAHHVLTPKMRDQLQALSKVKAEQPKEEPRQKLAMGDMAENADDQYRPPTIEMPPEGATMADLVQTKPMEEGQEFAPTPTPVPGMEASVGTSPVDPNVIAQNQASSAEQPIDVGAQQSPAASPQAPLAPGGLDLMNKGLANEQAGINADVKAQTALGKAELDVYKRKEEAQNLFNQEHAAKRSEIQKRIDDSRQAVAEAKINPQQYWTGDKDGNGGHSKWLSAIGMIIAGFDPAGRPNMAVQVLHKQMEANIQAQKENLGTKKTLLEANMKELKDVNDAEALTRIQLNDITQTQLAQAAAASRSPLAQAAAQKAIGQLQTSQAKEFDALATSQAQKAIKAKMLSGGLSNNDTNQDPSMFVPHVVPKEHQKAVFDEITAAQNTVHMSKQIMKAFDEATKENTVMKTGAGMLRTPASVYALHQHMQPTFQDLEGTVRQAAMDNTFKNVTPMPGDSQHTIQQKKEALTAYLQSKSSAPTAKAYGIDLSKFKSTNTHSAEDQQPVKGRDGRMYIKTTVNGKSGYVPVK